MRLINLRNRWQILTVAALLALAVLIGVTLSVTSASPVRQNPTAQSPLVQVQRAAVQDVVVTVRGQGTVQARSEVVVVPQVSGRVVALHPAFVAGGAFGAGETLVTIDPADHELKLAEAQAGVQSAEAADAAADAAIAEAQARVSDAQIEADRLRGLRERDVASSREADRAELGLDQAKAQLQAAEARKQSAAATRATARAHLHQAELNLKRTHVTLPFAGRVLQTQVGLGGYVVAGQPVATVYDPRRLEIPVPLEDRELAWFNIGGAEAASVTLTANFAGGRHTWPARAVRLEGRVDPRTRMVTVVMEPIEAPVEAAAANADRPGLMPGMFVEAVIEGRTLEAVVPVPRHALRRDDRIAVAVDGRLEMRAVRIAHRDERFAYVRAGIQNGGLQDGELVIIGGLDDAADGMSVRTDVAPTQSRGETATPPTSSAEGAGHD